MFAILELLKCRYILSNKVVQKFFMDDIFRYCGQALEEIGKYKKSAEDFFKSFCKTTDKKSLGISWVLFCGRMWLPGVSFFFPIDSILENLLFLEEGPRLGLVKGLYFFRKIAQLGNSYNIKKTEVILYRFLFEEFETV